MNLVDNSLMGRGNTLGMLLWKKSLWKKTAFHTQLSNRLHTSTAPLSDRVIICPGPPVQRPEPSYAQVSADLNIIIASIS